MRLYDDFMHMWSTVSEEERNQSQGFRELASSVCVDITNVYDYWHDHGYNKRGGSVAERYPNVMPPFEHLWLEFAVADIPMRGGISLVSVPDGDSTIVNLQFYNRYRTASSPLGTGGFRVDASGGIMPIGGKGGRAFITPLDNPYPFEDARELLESTLYAWVDVTFLSLSFMHCKNVSLELAPTTMSRQQIRNANRRGVQRAAFKTIVIDPHMTQKRVEGALRTPSQGHTKSLHIARGHFAHYTEDKPLFGKYTGTFWRPAHVRGSADVGTVYKDYKVKP